MWLLWHLLVWGGVGVAGRKGKKMMVMYIYIKMQISLEQPKSSLLPCHVKELWFVEAGWREQEDQKNYNHWQKHNYYNKKKIQQKTPPTKQQHV